MGRILWCMHQLMVSAIVCYVYNKRQVARPSSTLRHSYVLEIEVVLENGTPAISISIMVV